MDTESRDDKAVPDGDDLPTGGVGDCWNTCMTCRRSVSDPPTCRPDRTRALACCFESGQRHRGTRDRTFSLEVERRPIMLLTERRKCAEPPVTTGTIDTVR